MQFTPWDNPMGTDGFEFIEYAAPDPAALGALFERMGFTADRPAPPQERDAVPAGRDQLHHQCRARTRSRSASRACTGPSVCAIAFRVQDARAAYERALELGAWGYASTAGPMELNIPAIKGIGDSLIYFVDRWRGKNGAQRRRHRQHRHLRRRLRAASPGVGAPRPAGQRPDLHRPPDAQRAPRPHEGMGRLLRAAVQLPRSALLRHRRQADRREEQGHDQPLRQDPHPDQRRAATTRARSQEYLDLYHGEGIQHIALGTDDIYATVRGHEEPAAWSSRTPSTPTTTWSTSACPATARTSPNCKRLRILIDGATHQGAPNELLLQIFTQTVIGPIFFEIIQRKGDQGFGEGNFTRAVREHRAGPDAPRRAAGSGASDMNPPGTDVARDGINQGVAPVTYGARRSPAARRLCAAPRRLHLRAELDAATRAEQHDAVPPAVRAPGRAAAGAGLRRVHRCAAATWASRTTSRASRTSTQRLYPATRWEIVAVPGLIPEEAFFALLAQRRSRSPTGCASPKSSTTWSSPTSFTTCSATCRCCSTRSSPTTCRPTARAA